MDEKLTTGEKLDKIIEELEKVGTNKKFKLPLGVRMGKGKTRKKNFAVVQTVKTNGSVRFKMMKIEDDTIKIGENFYSASADNILKYKKYPMIIIPEWNIQPFSPTNNFKQAAKEGTLVAAEKLILTKMKQEAIKNKLSMNWKIVLIVLGLGAGLLYLLDYLQII